MFATKEYPIEETKNAQDVRLYADILVFVPYLAFLSTKKQITSFDKYMLAGMALVSIAYNWDNFKKNL